MRAGLSLIGSCGLGPGRTSGLGPRTGLRRRAGLCARRSSGELGSSATDAACEAAGLCHSGVDVACTASDERIELMLTLQLRDEPPS